MTAAPPAPGPHISRRAMFIGAGLLATAGVAAAATPRRHEQQLGRDPLRSVIPQAVGAWRTRPADDLVMPEQTETAEFYDQVHAEQFALAGRPDVMLLVAYGGAQSGTMRVHRPELCFTSAGFDVGHDANDQVRLRAGGVIPARSFEGRRGDRVEQVLYWIRIADGFPQSANAEHWAAFRSGLTGVLPDGVLVRMSMISPDRTGANALLKGFADQMLGAAPPRGRRLLAGRL